MTGISLRPRLGTPAMDLRIGAKHSIAALKIGMARRTKIFVDGADRFLFSPRQTRPVAPAMVEAARSGCIRPSKARTAVMEVMACLHHWTLRVRNGMRQSVSVPML